MVTSDSGSTHTISCTGGSSTNYNFTTTATGTLTVIPAPLTVTPFAKNLSYGAAIPATSFFDFVITGYKNSQNSTALSAQPTCSAPSYTNTTNASPPTVAITCANGAATNYSFNYVAGALTVNKAPSLTITTANLSVNRGATITPTYSASGLAAGAIGSIAYTYTGTGSTSYNASKTAPTAVGTYSISIANPASDITFTTGSLSNLSLIHI